MELKDFVAGALTQIADGIAEAQQASDGKYRISPKHVARGVDPRVHFEYEGDTLECVDFDVVVTTKKSVEGEGKARIFVVDGGVQAQFENEHSSRIKFQVFVEWPRQR